MMFCVSFAACSDDDDSPASPISTDFKVTTTEITALKSGGTYSLIVQSDKQPNAEISADWITISSWKNSGSKNQIWTADVNVEPNSINSDRTATITVSQGNGSTNTATVTVKQIAADGLYISSSDVPTTVPVEGGTYTVKVLANVDFKVSSSASWVTVKAAPATRADMTEHAYEVTVANNISDERAATITFTTGSITTELDINQAGRDASMDKTAVDIAKAIYAGWNIGNTLEAYNGSTPSETAWGNPKITEDLIKSIKAAGFNAVRLPTAWDGYIEDRSTYKISDSWLNRVDQIVNWCVSNDLYVIVNIHWDGGWLENNCTEDKKEANIAEQRALWTQIATKLGGYDEHLLFAGCNEPNASDAAKMSVLREYEQTFVDAVRATGGRNYYRTLIIQGPDTNIDETVSLFTMPTDVVSDRLMAEVHYYDPWQFCGMTEDASWGNMAYFWGDYKVGDSKRDASWGDLSYMQKQFKKMKDMFTSKGIPVILGEYGAITNHDNDITDADQLTAHHNSRYQYNKLVTREAKNYGLVPFMWDTGEGMNRSTGAITKDYIIPAIMEGAAEGNYPY
jgi:aryl-phospho-beta-D-glucosidase BglC (GH1 family)